MRILITGGAGFVGSSLAIKWKRTRPDYTIIVADNLVRRGSELNLSQLKSEGIEFIHTDIRIAEDTNMLPHADVIVDASADPSVLAGIQSSTLRLIQSNLIGTVNLLEWADKHKAKFIFLSTSRIYPFGPLNDIVLEQNESRFTVSNNQTLTGVSLKGISEEFTLHGARSFYGAAKLSSELLIQEYIELKQLQATILRCGVIAGPGQFGKVDQGVIVFWLANHYWKKQLGYFGYGGEGKQVRDIMHIDDLYRIIDYQLHHNTLQGKTINVGGGAANSISLKELTALCESITGNKLQMTKVAETRIADIPYYVTDNTMISSLCGWHPEKSIHDVLKETFQWILNHEAQLKNILA